MGHSVWEYLERLPTEKLEEILSQKDTLLPEIAEYIRYILVKRRCHKEE
ncbi:MAG: hypothetical protein IKJ94_03815 [Oscillospiraceae bacterium]|nr:hypothetical protein [Oscillospiraceae bacterium]